MPELPEVETIVRDLQIKVLGRTFIDARTDFKKIVKRQNFEEFKKEIKGKKILNVWRRGKNIIFDLSKNLSLLIHQKLTGHLLYGIWEKEGGKWMAKEKGPLQDSVNRFIHLMFYLDNGKMLALSDLRKFAKVILVKTEELQKLEDLKSLGPEPLEKTFTFQKFKECLKVKKGKIKQVLMNQTVIAGIGNIYSDEILWTAKIHPLKRIQGIKEEEMKRIYVSMKEVFKKAIRLKGDSISDYRLITGEKGRYQEVQKVYQREGKPCFRKDGGIIKRIKIGGRSAHFCPYCQKL